MSVVPLVAQVLDVGRQTQKTDFTSMRAFLSKRLRSPSRSNPSNICLSLTESAQTKLSWQLVGLGFNNLTLKLLFEGEGQGSARESGASRTACNRRRHRKSRRPAESSVCFSRLPSFADCRLLQKRVLRRWGRASRGQQTKVVQALHDDSYLAECQVLRPPFAARDLKIVHSFRRPNRPTSKARGIKLGTPAARLRANLNDALRLELDRHPLLLSGQVSGKHR